MALSSREQDIQMMLAAKCHIGTKNCDYQMQRYIFRRSPADATHIIDLGKTWDKLQLAARIICAIENPQDVVVLSARPYGQRAVLKFAQYTGTKALVGRFTPGVGCFCCVTSAASLDGGCVVGVVGVGRVWCGMGGGD